MDANELTERLGKKLRQIRQQRNLSLDELAAMSGVSKPMLGQIERGVSNPSVALLWKVASGLGVPFTTFVADDPVVRLLHPDEQTAFYEDERRFQVYSTFAKPGVPVELFRVRLLPGCRRRAEAHAPGVLESITVSEGEMTVTVNDRAYQVRSGDCFQFDADVSHSYENSTDTACWAHLAIIYR